MLPIFHSSNLDVSRSSENFRTVFISTNNNISFENNSFALSQCGQSFLCKRANCTGMLSDELVQALKKENFFGKSLDPNLATGKLRLDN